MTDRRPRVAVVSGSSSGIGLATAIDLLNEGWIVYGCSRSSDIPDEIRGLSHSDRYEHFSCDVRSSLETDAFIRTIADRVGSIDALVNCAGISGGGPLESISNELWNNIISTNLSGVFHMTRSVLAYGNISASDFGRIVSVASTAGKQGVLMATPYSASKHGVVGFMKSLALELAPLNITANAVCPGYVETPMAVRVRKANAAYWGKEEQEVLEEFNAKIPLGRYSTPNEVSSLILYLLSDSAASITGQALNVCGGLGRY